MAIATIDSAVAGLQWARPFGKLSVSTLIVGRPASLWAGAGNPSAGSYDNTLNGVALSSTSSQVTGQINFIDPPSGNTYLARFLTNCDTNSGTLYLADRLWHNGGFTISSTSAQNITSPTWPARDADGATNGNGVLLAVEISSQVGSGSPTITISYTNQSGTSGRTGTNCDATASNAAAGSMFRIGLQSGDTGVRSVESLTLSATWTSGTMNLVAYRPIAAIPFRNGMRTGIDILTGGFPRMYNGSVPYLIATLFSTSAFALSGSIAWTQG